MNVKMVPIRTEPSAKMADFKQVEQQLHQAMADSPDVLVLSEMWNSGFDVRNVRAYADTSNQCMAFLSHFAASHRVNIVGGSIAVIEQDKLYNRAMVFDRTGRLIHQYDKWHLFSYAGEHEVFTPGNDNLVFTLDDMCCAVIICYDLRFGEQILSLRKQGAEVLFVPAAWPSARLEHWQTLLAARAIEFQLYVVGVNDGLYGASGIYDPLGKRFSQDGAELNKAALDIRKTFPVFSDRKTQY